METKKIWIFQSKSEFTEDESFYLKNTLNKFIPFWKAHGNPLKAYYEILKNKFLIIYNDESFCKTSGCSIDEMTNQIKKIDEYLNLGLLERTLVSYEKNNQIKTIPINEFKTKLKNKEILENDFVYNLSVSNETQFNENFKQLVSKSWAKIYLN